MGWTFFKITIGLVTVNALLLLVLLLLLNSVAPVLILKGINQSVILQIHAAKDRVKFLKSMRVEKQQYTDYQGKEKPNRRGLTLDMRMLWFYGTSKIML